jgi:hypothetical protein
MRLRQPPELDLRSLFEAYFAEKRAAAEERRRSKDGIWRWHASELGSCTRQLILRRAALNTDGRTLESELTFELGHRMHDTLTEAAYARARRETPEPAFAVLGHDVGGDHPTLLLTGEADLVYSVDAVPMIMDLKTESNLAAPRRRQEASLAGAKTSARWSHRLQVRAYKLIIEALHPEWGEIAEGWVLYLNKETGDFDQQPVHLADMEGTVEHRLAELEDEWARGSLPPRLPDQHEMTRTRPPRATGRMLPNGLCRPVSDTDPRGKYCDCRRICMDLPA